MLVSKRLLTSMSSPRTSRRPTGERQEELASAALELIATRGITALTTRALAQHVGITSGAIFRHFPTLDALLDAVVARVERLLAGTFPPEGLPPRARLARFVEARSTAVASQVGVLQLVSSEQFQLALPPAAVTRLQKCIDQTRVFVVSTLRAGQADGTIRDDLDAKALAVIVMGTTRMLALKRGGADPRAVQRALAKLLEPVGAKRGRRDSGTLAR